MAKEKKPKIPSFGEALEGHFKKGLLYQKQEEILSRTRWRIPSGAATLDAALGGAFPMGKVVQIVGPEGCRKTSFLVNLIKQAQLLGGLGAYQQTEETTDFEWFTRMGVRCDDKAFKTSEFIFPPETNYTMEAFANAEKFLDSYREAYPPNRSSKTPPGPPFITGLDSLGATQSQDEMRLVMVAEGPKEKDEPAPGGIAWEVSRGIRRVASKLIGINASFVYVNHVYEKIGVKFGKKTETRGGRAIKYFNDVSIELSRFKKPWLDKPGNQILARVQKSKVSFDGAEVLLDIYSDGGVDNCSSIWSYLREKGVLKFIAGKAWQLPWQKGEDHTTWDDFVSSYGNSGTFREQITTLLYRMVRESPKIDERYHWTPTPESEVVEEIESETEVEA